MRAGYACTTVDYFGDLDQKAIAPNVALGPDLGQPYSAKALVRAAEGISADSVVYGADLENHPAAVARLASGRELLGNAAETLARARDVNELAAVMATAGIAVPRTLPGQAAGEAELLGRWLRKRRRSGGGIGIVRWQPGQRLRPDEVLQEFVDGTPGAAVFVADGRRALVLGVSRQLIGDGAFGAAGFRYCGSVLPLTDDGAEFCGVLCQVQMAAQAAAAAFALRGVCGIDFVVRDGAIHVLEINPRCTASMELVEQAYGISIFDVHVRACRGWLPEFDLSRRWAAGSAFGKAILFARRRVALGDTRPWLRLGVRDIPRPGASIAARSPICTLFARAREPRACERELHRQARVWEGAIARGRASRKAS